MLHKLDFHGNGFSADLGLSSSQLFKLLWRARHWSLASFPSKGGLPARTKMLSITGMAPPDGLINNAGILVGSGFLRSFVWSQKEKKRRYHYCLPPELYTAIPRLTSLLACRRRTSRRV
jgi:hypothetical protein